MADQSKVLETMASQITAVAAGLEALRVQGAAQTAANAETADKLAEMQKRLSQHDALLTGDGPSVLSTAAPVARPQDWEIRVPRRFLPAGVQSGVRGHEYRSFAVHGWISRQPSHRSGPSSSTTP